MRPTVSPGDTCLVHNFFLGYENGCLFTSSKEGAHAQQPFPRTVQEPHAAIALVQPPDVQVSSGHDSHLKVGALPVLACRRARQRRQVETRNFALIEVMCELATAVEERPHSKAQAGPRRRGRGSRLEEEVDFLPVAGMRAVPEMFRMRAVL